MPTKAKTKTLDLNEAQAHLLLFGILAEAKQRSLGVLIFHYFIKRCLWPNAVSAELREALKEYEPVISGPGRRCAAGPSHTFLFLDGLCGHHLREKGAEYILTPHGQQAFHELRERFAGQLEQLEQLAAQMP